MHPFSAPRTITLMKRPPKCTRTPTLVEVSISGVNDLKVATGHSSDEGVSERNQ